MSGARATGYVPARVRSGGSEPPRVTAVATSEGLVPADVVVDAMGRRSPTPAWLASLGARLEAQRSSECRSIYYSRYYRVREGRTLPDGPWVPPPRGDLGYAAFSTFPGDNHTFAAILAIRPDDQELTTRS